MWFDSLSQSRLDTYNADVISFDCRNGLEGNPVNGDHFFWYTQENFDPHKSMQKLQCGVKAFY